MAVGFWKKVGDFFKRTAGAIVGGIPKALEVGGNVVGLISPTIGNAMKKAGQWLSPYAQPAGKALDKVLNGTKPTKDPNEAEAKQLREQQKINEGIEKVGKFATEGLNFLGPVFRKFKAA